MGYNPSDLTTEPLLVPFDLLNYREVMNLRSVILYMFKHRIKKVFYQ